MNTSIRFWEQKSLREMTKQEWELLCDGCGKCCLHKLEDEVTSEVKYTAVACRLLDLKTIRCTNYKKRARLVADCLRLPPPGRGAWSSRLAPSNFRKPGKRS